MTELTSVFKIFNYIKRAEHSNVIPIYILYFEKSFSLREAQAMTIDTLEEIRTIVFTVAIGH